MDGWMDGWMDGYMHGWMDGWMDGWMEGRMDGWMDEWMDGRVWNCPTNFHSTSISLVLALFFGGAPAPPDPPGMVMVNFG